MSRRLNHAAKKQSRRVKGNLKIVPLVPGITIIERFVKSAFKILRNLFMVDI